MKIVPISPEAHKNTKVKVGGAPEHIANQHIIALTAPEFMQAATSFPIVFIKDGERFRPVAVMGFQDGDNYILDGDKWNGVYVPKSVQRVPFLIAPDPEKEKTLTSCIDMDNPLVGETEGEALFDDKGEPTEYLKSVQKFLNDIYHSEVASEQFIDALNKLELITEINVKVSFQDQSKNKRLTGMYTIDDKKLRELNDEQALDFHKKGYHAPAHAMLVSLGQFNRLVRHNNEQNDAKILGVQLSGAEA